jgi:hypothetical protein
MAAASETAVSGLSATSRSFRFCRARYPRSFTRMVNHVGSPAMFEGKRFFPPTGTPIWKMARRSVVLAVWLPEPFTVATWRLNSLTREVGALKGEPFRTGTRRNE